MQIVEDEHTLCLQTSVNELSISPDSSRVVAGAAHLPVHVAVELMAVCVERAGAGRWTVQQKQAGLSVR